MVFFFSSHFRTHVPHCNINPIYVFPEKELRGLASVPNSQIPVSVSDLYIPRTGPNIFLQQNRQTDFVKIYIAHRHNNVEIGTGAIPFLGIFVSILTSNETLFIFESSLLCSEKWPYLLSISHSESRVLPRHRQEDQDGGIQQEQGILLRHLEPQGGAQVKFDPLVYCSLREIL